MALGWKLMKEDKALKTDGKAYKCLVGSLLYLTATRLNIVFAVNYLSRFMQGPRQIQFVVAKRVMRYLNGTLEFGMYFVKSSFVKLVGFSNSDWDGNDEEMMSTLGYCFAIGESILYWNSKAINGCTFHYRGRI